MYFMAREMLSAGLVLGMLSGSVSVTPREELAEISTVAGVRTTIRIRAGPVGAQRRSP